MFAEDKDAAQKEEERLMRSLNKVGNHAPKIKPAKATAAAKTPTAASTSTVQVEKTNWRQQEEERAAREEERQRHLAEEKQQKIETVVSASSNEKVEDDFLQRAWSISTTEEANERLKRQEDLIQKHMFRATPGRSGPSQEEIDAHNQKIQQQEEEKKRQVAEDREREHNRALAYEKQFPRFEVDGQKLLEIISELNKVRVSPKLYAKYLQELLDENRFSGTAYKVQGTETIRETKEGEEGFKKAIEFLKGCQRLKMFTHSDGLSLSCYDLIRNHNPLGLTGATMSDGTTPEDRVQKYGKITSPWEELFIYKYATPSDIVVQWIVDDDDPTRRRRNIILNSVYTTIGICLGPNSKHQDECAVTFCAGFEENSKN